MIQKNVKLSSLTSWLVGGEAQYFSQPSNLDELKESIKWANENQAAITILGGGTNVLISDDGIKGLVISTRKLKSIESKIENNHLVIEALTGTPKALLLKTFLQHKLSPALFLAGLPGDVGGGVVMNAGVGEMIEPREFVEIVDWVEVLRDQKIIRLQKDELNWSYRHCEGWRPGVVYRVGFKWPMNPDTQIVEKVKEANKIRLTKQPLDLPSCGSVFVNPPGHKSGQLIEACGLKGFTIGGAQVSTKHANFIVNINEAKAKDIDQLIRHVQKVVEEKKQVQLRTEVVYLGEWK